MWIYEHKDWPHFTWNSEVLASKLADIRYRQGRLFGQMHGLGFELKTQASLSTLTKDVVKSSAIEGEFLNPEQVRSSIARKLGIEADVVAPSRDVEAIVEVMLDATQKFSQPLTKSRLFSWHGALFPTGLSGLSKIRVGNWRSLETEPMHIVSGPVGREKVHFVAPHASCLEEEMANFLKWFNAENKQDPIIKAGIAHFWFVILHPFEDGNGRIGRAICDMALARADNSPMRFYSLSSQIQAEQKQYYKILEVQQISSLDLTPWLSWFLDCLETSISNAEKSLEHILYKARLWDFISQKPVNARQSSVIKRMLEENFAGFINTSKYAKLVKCSNDTALRDIQELTARAILVRNTSGGRSTSYRLIESIGGKNRQNLD